MYPFTELTRGSKIYWKGVKWLKQHPAYLFLLLIPSLLGLAGMIGTGALFLKYHAELLRFFVFDPGESWFKILLYYLASLLFYITALVSVLLIGVIVSNVVASPVYEFISQAIEKKFFPDRVSLELSFWQSLKTIPEELKKALLIGFLSLALFLIPGLNLLALFGTAFLVAWDFYDYPLARRGLKLTERLKLARKDVWAMLGMSFWFLIPVVQLVLVPMAVVGGTLMSLERLSGPQKRS